VYQSILPNLTFDDWKQHEWNRVARPRLAKWGLTSRWEIQRDRPS